jgi:lipopolysaccharide/colanic/teichoic acid biosynthesis glycosyltransferase
MRRGHFDELPQLINVLKGEMSLVGPRPERPEIASELRETFPDLNERLAVRPGITGLAQIRNGYDETLKGVRRKLNYDIEYINSRGFGLELYILAATLPKFNDNSAH